MHPDNPYRGPHDLSALGELEPRLKEHFITTPDGRLSLDFTDQQAVYLLNRTLLLRDFGLTYWDVPDQSLTPPVPGRLDYLLAINDLLPETKHVLDIGTGASLIYPILGVTTFGWSFTATDVSVQSLKVAGALVQFNPVLKHVELRLQPDSRRILHGIIGKGDRFDVTICNPPFFASAAEARSAGAKKWAKLGREGVDGLSFGGTATELFTPGGEVKFLHTLIGESAAFADRVRWFTTLVSKKGYLRAARKQLERVGVAEVRELPLSQGNKQSRILAWRYA